MLRAPSSERLLRRHCNCVHPAPHASLHKSPASAGSTASLAQTLLSFALSSLVSVAVVISLPEIGPARALERCTGPALAFRFDDVQDYWLSDAQGAVIELFAQRDMPLTLAVIGGFFGNDKRLVETIRSNLSHSEIANHGLH